MGRQYFTEHSNLLQAPFLVLWLSRTLALCHYSYWHSWHQEKTNNHLAFWQVLLNFSDIFFPHSITLCMFNFGGSTVPANLTLRSPFWWLFFLHVLRLVCKWDSEFVQLWNSLSLIMPSPSLCLLISPHQTHAHHPRTHIHSYPCPSIHANYRRQVAVLRLLPGFLPPGVFGDGDAWGALVLQRL